MFFNSAINMSNDNDCEENCPETVRLLYSFKRLFVNYLQHPFVTGDDEDPVLHASVMVSIFKVYSCIIQILIIVICILMY